MIKSTTPRTTQAPFVFLWTSTIFRIRFLTTSTIFYLSWTFQKLFNILLLVKLLILNLYEFWTSDKIFMKTTSRCTAMSKCNLLTGTSTTCTYPSISRTPSLARLRTTCWTSSCRVTSLLAPINFSRFLQKRYICPSLIVAPRRSPTTRF